MKINFKSRSRSAYALIIILVMSLFAVMILGGTLKRTYGVAAMNSRAVDMMNCQNAAEAAMEMVFSRMQYDFQSQGGITAVSNNLTLYRSMYPVTSQDPYWGNFQFSDAQGGWNSKTYVSQIGTFTGPLPTAYSNRSTFKSPVYRIVSNAKPLHSNSGAVGAAQEDIMLALIPLTDFAIFYNGLLEFSTCATMTVNGAVHSNTNIYVGAGNGATLTFNSSVTSSGLVSAPANDGQNIWGNATNYNSSWNTTFNSSPNFINHNATIQISINMTNTHSLIDVPATNDSATVTGQQRLYNQAQIQITVSNLNATDSFQSNVIVSVKIQKAPTSADVPGADATPTIINFNSAYINQPASAAALAAQFPFLTLTNIFYDQREKTTNVTSQIDIAQYRMWLTNITSPVLGKFAADGSSGYPTILYVNDLRNTTTVGGKKLAVVRLVNGIAPPPNGGLGFSVATPNPLYLLGNYNQTVAGFLGTSNTSSGTVPCAFMSDSFTVLSANWSDNNSMHNTYGSGGGWGAITTTINAAILTGNVPSTGTDASHYSGGVHNLPRLLENWGGDTLWINTSMINLYASTKATGQFINPGAGSYYDPPTRKFSYDNNFSDPAKVPPGIPCALVALRYNWATPPPNTVTYNVTP